MKKVMWKWNINGFTLLEVMIAVAIISITAVTIIHTRNRSLDMLSESIAITTATLLAKQKMVEVEIKGFPETGEDEGDFEEEEYKWLHWRRIVSPMNFSEHIRKIEVIVSWKNGEKRYVNLITYIAEKKILAAPKD
ncbi:MAG: prepilin-type N-terminal cleavage/methylation domain-containing protein [Nitrospinota bacterium]